MPSSSAKNRLNRAIADAVKAGYLRQVGKGFSPANEVPPVQESGALSALLNDPQAETRELVRQ